MLFGWYIEHAIEFCFNIILTLNSYQRAYHRFFLFLKVTPSMTKVCYNFRIVFFFFKFIDFLITNISDLFFQNGITTNVEPFLN